jgi:hypothetical protein
MSPIAVSAMADMVGPPAERLGGSIGGADINMVPRRRRYEDAYSPTAVELLLL